MVSLNDVLLAMSNVPVSDPIAEIWGRELQGGYEIIEYTGTLPITINADGMALIDYCIYGNTVQDGTPTPENPIMPSGCGVRTENLWNGNITAAWIGYNGVITYDQNSSSIIIECDSEREYTIKKFSETNRFRVISYESFPRSGMQGTVLFSDDQANEAFVSTPTNSKYLAIYINSTYSSNEKVVITFGSTAPTSYIPYGYKLPMVSRTENLFDISEITECSVGTISRYGVEYTDIGYYTITTFGALNGWCYIRVLNGDNIVSTAYLIVPNHLTPIKINLSVGQRFVIYNANPDNVEATTSLFNQWKPVVLYSNSSQPEYPSSYIPYSYKLSPIYLGESQTTRRIKKLVLTGAENSLQLYTNSAGKIGFNLEALDMLSNSRTNGFCTHFVPTQSITWVSGNNVCFGANNAIIYFIFSDAIATQYNITDLTSIKAYLQAQYAAETPVTVWYVLAAPGTGIVNEPLMKIGDYADMVSMAQAGVSIPTVAGATVIDYDGAPKPSEMYIKYRR